MNFFEGAAPFWVSAIALLYGPVFAQIFRSSIDLDMDSLLNRRIFEIPKSLKEESATFVGALHEVAPGLVKDRLKAITARAAESSAIAASSLSLAVTLLTNSVLQKEFGLVVNYAPIAVLLVGLLASGHVVNIPVDRYESRRKIGPFPISTLWFLLAYVALGIAAGCKVAFWPTPP